MLTVFSGTPHWASKSSYRRERVSGVFLPRNSLCLCLYPDKLTLSYLIICIPYCRLGDLISARLFAVFVRMSLTAERVTLPSDLSFFLVTWFWITDFSRCFWGLVCLVGLQTWVLCLSEDLDEEEWWRKRVLEICLCPAENWAMVQNISSGYFWRKVCKGSTKIHFK